MQLQQQQQQQQQQRQRQQRQLTCYSDLIAFICSLLLEVKLHCCRSNFRSETYDNLNNIPFKIPA